MHEARGVRSQMWHTIWEFYIVNIHDTDVMQASSVSMVDKGLPSAPIARGCIFIHQFKILHMFRSRQADFLPTHTQRRC